MSETKPLNRRAAVSISEAEDIFDKITGLIEDDELLKKISTLRSTFYRLSEDYKENLQAEKLDAVGRLAAGAAHELNNPLTGILGFTQLLLQEPDLPTRQKEDLESIYRQSQRCRQIIQNLLHFSHRKEIRKETLRISEILDAAVEGAMKEFSSSGLKIHKDYRSDLPVVSGDRTLLQQVFSNILLNAHQALEKVKGGIVTVRARARGPVMEIRVEDSGPGTTPENLKRIFDPFFTTRPVGAGTGLGLSMAHGIIEQHGGGLRAENMEKGGFAVVVEIPFKNGNLRRRKILLVEDEEVIRALCQRVLQASDHDFESVDSITLGLDRIRRAPPDLLITDLKLPDGEGWELIRELRQISEESKSIVITGLPPLEIRENQPKDLDRVQCLRKPFDMDHFIKTVRDSMEG